VLPSEQDTTKLTAVVPEGKQQSKEMVMFLFTTTAQELKSSYTVNEMRNLLSSMPYQHRKVVNRYVNIVK
jgi:negative regulator of replication initiation